MFTLQSRLILLYRKIMSFSWSYSREEDILKWTTLEYVITLIILSSVQFSHSVLSDSLQSHGLQQVSPPCPSKTSRVYPNSCSLSWWNIQPSHPLLSLSPVFNLSQYQGLFKWISSSLQLPKYWSFRFNISASSEYSGLVAFRMDWLDLLAVQGTLKNLFQHQSSKASILRYSISL